MKKVKYYLTKKGLEGKLDLTLHFLKKREAEYYFIKDEWGQLKVKR